LFGSVFYEATGTTDPQAHDETFSRRFGTDFWSWLEEHPPERAAFDAAMAGGKERHAERLASLEWRDEELVVDVGGGNGALLRALIARHPQLRGIVFDLPAADRNDADFHDRLRFVPGSFFETMPEGDVYLLSGILHDWSDERANAILQTIRRAGPAHVRLLVIDTVVATGNEPQGGKWLDLLMLVIGGRERTGAEWRGLLEGAGFSVESVEDGLIQASCR
jgi:hypothetical protein